MNRVEHEAEPVTGMQVDRQGDQSADPGGHRRRLVGLLAGPAVMVAVLIADAPGGMTDATWRTAAVTALMAIWWITEAIPISATALLPLALFPLLGILGIEAAAAPYANSVIFLFLGGFLLAQGMQRWNLHRRIALLVILAVGTEPVRLIGGFMLATALLSMWVSNTATAMMMLPIGLSVVELLEREQGPGGLGENPNFPIALMLGIAYACSIGGLATLIGTPPNALLAGYLSTTFQIELGFGQWMLVGVPLVAVGLPLSWAVLTRVTYPVRIGAIGGSEEVIRRELREMGPISRGEITAGVIFGLTAVAWITQPLLARLVPGISDAGIAITGALLLFLVPVDLPRGVFALDWEHARRIPWEVLVLFGGGLSLAAAINDTGLAAWIGDSLDWMGALPTIGLIFGIVLVVIFLTELTSNTATAATFLPILGGLATGIGAHPLLLTVPAALAATCAFMLPVATPPNAIIFGGGHVSIPQMARGGLYLNGLFAILITFLGYALISLVLIR